jgi:hypothetical protein
MLKAVKVKGSSIYNKVLAKSTTQHTGGLRVETDPYVGEVGEGVKIMSIGEDMNPQDLVHIELASAECGLLSPDHKKNFTNRTKLPSKKRHTGSELDEMEDSCKGTGLLARVT